MIAANGATLVLTYKTFRFTNRVVFVLTVGCNFGTDEKIADVEWSLEGHKR